MKQFYIFILVFSFGYFGFAQFTSIQLELVDPLVGTPTATNWEPENTSNDEGLNAIFASTNVYNYYNVYPTANLSGNGYAAFCIIYCDSADVSQLISDLNNYNTVVAYAREEIVEGVMVNVLDLALVDENIGVQTGTNGNNVITTNDTGLSQIFENFNVREYNLYLDGPADTNYSLVCDCDAQLLKTELENYSAVVANTWNVNYVQLLSINEVQKTTVNIHPNPFKEKVNIEINKSIESIMLYSILGKQVYKSTSIIDFESFTSNLKSGVYLLKLMTTEGESITKKLIKS
tara:strand:+ start:1043 stop:1912 length:870 start_codon:yes stop_codon:yes gene_type:complete